MEIIKSRLYSFLRWGERYTGTDNVYLARGGFWLGLSQLAASIAAFILTIVLANLLAPEVLGEYRFLMSGLLILSVFTLPGVTVAIMESTPKGFKGNLGVAFRETMKWGRLGALVSFIVATYYFWQDNTTLALGFAAIALALPIFSAGEVYNYYLKALREFKKVAVYATVTRTSLLILSVIAAITFPSYAWIILTAFLLGQIIPNLIFHKKTATEYVSPEAVSDPGLIPYAKHLTAMSALGLVAAQLDKVIVWKLLGAEELAIFFIAYAIPLEVTRFLNLMPTLAFPKFADTSPETIRQTLMPKIWKYFLITTTCVAAYLALAPWLFKFLFPQYIEAVPYSQILMLSVIGAVFSPIGTYFTVLKAKKILYTITTIIPTIRIVALVILTPILGMWGVVSAIIIEAFINALLLIGLFKKKWG